MASHPHILRLLAIAVAVVALAFGAAAAHGAPPPEPGQSPAPAADDAAQPTEETEQPDAGATEADATPPTQDEVDEAVGDVGEIVANAANQSTAEDRQKKACANDSFMPKLPSVECMTFRAVDALFGSSDDRSIAEGMAAWLIAIPPFAATVTGEVAQAGWVGRSIGLALLMGVMTLAVMHYWAAGMVSSGNGMLMDAIVRAGGAALLILAWPTVFQSVTGLTNVVTNLILPNESVTDGMGAILAAATAAGALGGLTGALIVAVGVVLLFTLFFLALVVIKLGLVAGLLVAYIGMPIAIALWPLPSTSAPASYGMRFIGMGATTVVLWALSFRAFGVINPEVGMWTQGLALGPLMGPLLGIAELGVLLAVPKHVAVMWNVASNDKPGGGMVGNMLRDAGSRMLASRMGDAGKFKPSAPAKPEWPISTPKGQQPVRAALSAGGQPKAIAGAAQKQAIAARTPQKALPAAGGGGKVPPKPGSGALGNRKPGNGKPGKPGNGTAGAAPPKILALGRDGLPQSVGDRSRLAAANRRVAEERGANGGDGPSTDQTRAAIAHVSSIGGGSYAQPLRDAIGSDGGGAIGSTGDTTLSGRMASAGAAAGLAPATIDAFHTIGAATPETRKAAQSIPMSGAIPMPPATPPKPSSTT